MTNAEYIRNMSDEKLAAWLWNHMGHDVFCEKMCPKTHSLCRESASVYRCADCINVWLRQEHEE
jgi:hypothetical protein